ncbi:MAG: hypothetical protein GY757_31170 [bacterium]|nr:hypothetical protein [bacterium]
MLRWLRPGLAKTDEILGSFALGLGLTGLFVFIPGVLGIINTMLYALWIFAGLGLFVYFALRKWLPVAPKLDLKAPLNILGLVVIIPLLLQALPPLVSPVISVDALEYHLLIPKIFVKMGKIEYIPSLVESNYPCFAQFIYTIIIPLAGDIVCKAMHFWTGIFLLFSMSRLTARVSPESNRLLGPALFLSMPVVILIFGWAWNDLFFVFFLLQSLSFLLDYQMAAETQRSSRNLLLAGIMAGLACWTKYTFVMILFTFIPLLLVALFRWRWKWYRLLWFATPIGVMSLLVFVKNWIFTGNPFYPFLNTIFASPYWNQAAADYFFKAMREWEFADWSWTTYFTFPFHLTLTPRLIDVHTGILPLVLVPLLFFRSPNKGVTFLKTFILSYVGVWMLIQTETRSLLTLLAVIFCVGAIGLERLIWSGKPLRRVLVILLCLAVLANLGIVVVTNYYLSNPVRYLLGLEGRNEFLKREALAQPVYSWLNNNASVRCVLLVGLYGPYYLERFPYFSSVVDPPITEVLSAGIHDPQVLRTQFRKLGITHIVLNKKKYTKEIRDRLYSWPAAQRGAFESLLKKLCKPVAQFGSFTIYALTPEKS